MWMLKLFCLKIWYRHLHIHEKRTWKFLPLVKATIFANTYIVLNIYHVIIIILHCISLIFNFSWFQRHQILDCAMLVSEIKPFSNHTTCSLAGKGTRQEEWNIKKSVINIYLLTSKAQLENISMLLLKNVLLLFSCTGHAVVDLKVRLCNSFVFSSETATRGEVSLLQFTVGVGIRGNFVLQTWRMSLPFLKKRTPLCCHSDRAVWLVTPPPLFSRFLPANSQNNLSMLSPSRWTSLLLVVSFILVQVLRSHFITQAAKGLLVQQTDKAG